MATQTLVVRAAGTGDATHTTIQGAIDDVATTGSASDLVQIQIDGVFNERVSLAETDLNSRTVLFMPYPGQEHDGTLASTNQAGITLTSGTGHAMTIDFSTANAVTVRGLVIRQYSSGATSDECIRLSSSGNACPGFLLEDCLFEIHDLGGQGDAVYVGNNDLGSSADPVLIRDCMFVGQGSTSGRALIHFQPFSAAVDIYVQVVNCGFYNSNYGIARDLDDAGTTMNAEIVSCFASNCNLTWDASATGQLGTLDTTGSQANFDDDPGQPFPNKSLLNLTTATTQTDEYICTTLYSDVRPIDHANQVDPSAIGGIGSNDNALIKSTDCRGNSRNADADLPGPYAAEAGGSGQTINAGSLSSALLAPTLAAGGVSITPGSQQVSALNAPSVLSDFDLLPPAQSAALFGPSLSPGAVAIAAGVVLAAIATPTPVAAGVTLEPDSFAVATPPAPTAAPGDVTTTPAAVAVASPPAPTAAPGDVTIGTDLLAATLQDPAVAPGEVAVAPAAVQVDALSAPTVVAGGVIVAPDGQAASLFAPTLELGAVVQPAALGTSLLAPSLLAEFTLAPPALAASLFGPTLLSGLSVSPERLNALLNTPALAPGGVTVSPIALAAALPAPSLQASYVLLPASQAAALFDPNVVGEAIVQPGELVALLFAPQTVPGQVTVSPDPLAASVLGASTSSTYVLLPAALAAQVLGPTFVADELVSPGYLVASILTPSPTLGYLSPGMLPIHAILLSEPEWEIVSVEDPDKTMEIVSIVTDE